MILVGAMATALWGIGMAMKMPLQARRTMLAILLVGVMALHVILPNGHPLRMATGGDARLWGVLIAFGFLVWGYRKFLGMLRAKVADRETPKGPPGAFSNTELNRYARHIVLREIGGPGQRALPVSYTHLTLPTTSRV